MNVKKILAKKESKMPLNNLCKKVIKKIVELDSEILGGTGFVMDYVEIQEEYVVIHYSFTDFMGGSNESAIYIKHKTIESEDIDACAKEFFDDIREGQEQDV